MDSSSAGKSSLGTDSSIVSCVLVASNEPSLSILHLNGHRGGSKATNDGP